VLALQVAPVRDGATRASSGIILATDVSAARRLEAEQRRIEKVYHAVVTQLPNGGVLVVDTMLRFVSAAGPAAATVASEAQLDSLVGRNVSDVASAGNAVRVVEVFRAALAGQSRRLEVALGERVYDVDIVPIFAGSESADASHAMAFLHDVTQRKAELDEVSAARAKLEQLTIQLEAASVTDSLTGLLNRRGLRSMGERQITASTRTGKGFTLMFLDVDGMKAINDKRGHAAGDRALVQVAALLRGVFRATDLLSRLGGDEFVVVAVDATDSEGAESIERLRESLRRHNLDTENAALALSIGTARFEPTAATTLEQLIAEADARMYVEKQGSQPPVTRRKRVTIP
jgi:diguanylate cyclase (GGDEF)-like protein